MNGNFLNLKIKYFFLFVSPNLLPAAEREKLLREMIETMDDLDPELKKKLMQEIISNPNLIPADVCV